MVEIKFAATRFGNIAYREQGRGPAALFVHGVYMNGELWRPTIERVADVRRCVAVDMLGHGATRTPPDRDFSFRAQAEMLEEFCERAGLAEVDAVGNDSGSAIVQILAARHPARIRSITLTNGDVHDNWPPAAIARTIGAARRGVLFSVGQRLAGDVAFFRRQFAVAFEHPDRISAESARIWLEPLFRTPEAARALEQWFMQMDLRQTVEIEPLLRQFDKPALAVWGTDDVFFPIKWAYWLRQTIPGMRKVVELDGARLFFPYERPAALADALREHWRPA